VKLKTRCGASKKFSMASMDHLPEQAFYMVGPIEEVIAKAEKDGSEGISSGRIDPPAF